MTDYSLPIVIFLAIYFAPTCVALHRQHRQLKAIFAANLFFGFMVLGWGACMVWSLTTEKQA